MAAGAGRSGVACRRRRPPSNERIVGDARTRCLRYLEVFDRECTLTGACPSGTGPSPSRARVSFGQARTDRTTRTAARLSTLRRSDQADAARTRRHVRNTVRSARRHTTQWGRLERGGRSLGLLTYCVSLSGCDEPRFKGTANQSLGSDGGALSSTGKERSGPAKSLGEWVSFCCGELGHYNSSNVCLLFRAALKTP
jgi:hypothetical protein